jgi:hypothetical protein
MNAIAVNVEKTPSGVAKINGTEVIAGSTSPGSALGLTKNFVVPEVVELTLSGGTNGSSFENNLDKAAEKFDMILNGTLIFKTVNNLNIKPSGNLIIGERGGLTADGVAVVITLTAPAEEDDACLQIVNPAKVTAENLNGNLTIKPDGTSGNNMPTWIKDKDAKFYSAAAGIVLTSPGANGKATLKTTMDIVDETKSRFVDRFDLAAEKDDVFADIPDDFTTKVAGTVELATSSLADVKMGPSPTLSGTKPLGLNSNITVATLARNPANTTFGDYSEAWFRVSKNNTTHILRFTDSNWSSATQQGSEISGVGVVKFNNAEFECSNSGSLKWNTGTDGFHIGFRTLRQ